MLHDEATWMAASLVGDIEEAARIQGLTSREARLTMDEWRYTEKWHDETLENLLPLRETKAPPCPGFERLDAIMSIQPDPPDEKTLIANRQAWWAVTAYTQGMMSMANNQEQVV